MSLVDPNDAASPRAVFDALPFPAFIVDDDVRLLATNPAAASLLGGGPGMVLRQRGGEALRCIHSTETPEGCGRSPACRDCVIRNTVASALADGEPFRTRTVLECVRDGHVQEMHVLLTASPLVYENARRALLFIEDLAMLLARTNALPICMSCRKVRDDRLWMQLEAYLDSHLDLKFTHGLCPDCARKLYPNLAPQGGA